MFQFFHDFLYDSSTFILALYFGALLAWFVALLWRGPK